MIDWLLINWLAFYAAVVGTIALIVNIFRFRHVVNKERVKLSVSVHDHPDRTRNIRRLEDEKTADDWSRAHIVEAYEITMRNIGSVAAYIEDAGVICKDGKSHSALISEGRDTGMMSSISSVGQLKIEPKSSEKVSVYYSRDKDIFSAKKGYVVDSTGRKIVAKTS